MNNKKIDMEKLRRAYVGKKYDNFKKQKINGFAALFSVYYWLYRKMYLYSAIFMLVRIVLTYLTFIVVFSNTSYTVSIIVYGGLETLKVVAFILMMFFTNKLYLKFVDKQIEKIIQKYDDDELIDVAKVWGKTNIPASICLSVLIELSFFLITFYIFKL